MWYTTFELYVYRNYVDNFDIIYNISKHSKQLTGRFSLIISKFLTYLFHQ